MENYEKLPNGIIKQISINKIKYDENYVNVYRTYNDLRAISLLRLAYIVGSIGKIPDSILDIGYGTGEFLKTSNEIVKKCYGYDITGVKLDGIEIINNIFENHFEVITFFDSLEHFSEIDFLNKLDCDYIVISVPDCHNFSDEWFMNWKHRRENEHLWFFNQNSLEVFMREQGYSKINTTNIEDIIRKSQFEYPNILSGVFKKIK